MPTLLRVMGMFLGVIAVGAILGGAADDAPGLVLIGLMLAGVGVYAFLGSRVERDRMRRIEELLERLSR